MDFKDTEICKVEGDNFKSLLEEKNYQRHYEVFKQAN